MKAIEEIVTEVLNNYRCQYNRTEDGDALDLIDVLSPGETVAEGRKEIELLIDELVVNIEDELKKTEQPANVAALRAALEEFLSQIPARITRENRRDNALLELYLTVGTIRKLREALALAAAGPDPEKSDSKAVGEV